jgi:hypothetical protein
MLWPRVCTENSIPYRRFSENVISTDKSALLWMYCREIAPFETPTFSTKVGELIARATERPLERRQPISGKLER